MPTLQLTSKASDNSCELTHRAQYCALHVTTPKLYNKSLYSLMQTSTFPLMAASCSGVKFQLSLALESAPSFSRKTTTSAWPNEQALCRGIRPPVAKGGRGEGGREGGREGERSITTDFEAPYCIYRHLECPPWPPAQRETPPPLYGQTLWVVGSTDTLTLAHRKCLQSITIDAKRFMTKFFKLPCH